MGLVDATNHACDPSAFVDFSDPKRPVLRALRELSPDDEVTIHYGATEYDMQSPFACDCGSDACVGLMRGYRHLAEETAKRIEPWLSPVLRDLASSSESAPPPA